MSIKIYDNKIEIKNEKTFNIDQILQCGQIFRYLQTEKGYSVFETDYKIEIEKTSTGVVIFTKNPKRHLNYFDLETDYDKIYNRISKINPLLKTVADFGKGIRHLKQDFVETVISFAISANNNIPRIRKSLFALCEKFGEKKDGYFAFPNLKTLERITKEQWQDLGTGYRAGQLVELCKQLQNVKKEDFENLETHSARRKLISLSGVGPKVADCILLFGLSRKDVFPTDTWIKKVYKENFEGKEEDAKKISEILAKKFGQDSGMVQQYLFYFKREKGEK